MLGAAVQIPAASSRADIPLFNESQSRIVITVNAGDAAGDAAGVLAQLEKRGVPASQIGEVAASSKLEITTAGKSFSWPLAEIRKKWNDSIPALMGAGESD
jgi:phosphoribosylformylglycinamidine (FGAM) synthase-like enzyme